MNKKDFNEFEKSNNGSVPQPLSEKVISFVHSALNPSPLKVFSKLSLIHFFSAFVTLSVCPQFGFRLFGEGHGLMGYFMHLGSWGCTMACGSFFIGTSVFFAALVLKAEELRVIRNNKFLELGALTLLSLGFFLMLNTQIALGFLFIWALGSILGGIMTLELIWFIRLHKN